MVYARALKPNLPLEYENNIVTTILQGFKMLDI
jgi:hypothetical protein